MALDTLQAPPSLETLSRYAEEGAINCVLLYLECDRTAQARLHDGNRLIRYARILTAGITVPAAVCAYATYYQHSKVHRVWRLRFPKRVRQLYHTSLASGAAAAAMGLYVFSPWGPPAQHDRCMATVKHLDRLAVRALKQQQCFATLHAWCELRLPISSTTATTAPNQAQRRSLVVRRDGSLRSPPAYEDVLHTNTSAWRRLELPARVVEAVEVDEEARAHGVQQHHGTARVASEPTAVDGTRAVGALDGAEPTPFEQRKQHFKDSLMLPDATARGREGSGPKKCDAPAVAADSPPVPPRIWWGHESRSSLWVAYRSCHRLWEELLDERRSA